MADRDPSLEPFDALIGTWATEVGRSSNEHELFPDSLWIIGAPEAWLVFMPVVPPTGHGGIARSAAQRLCRTSSHRNTMVIAQPSASRSRRSRLAQLVRRCSISVCSASGYERATRRDCQ
jgi:hypothetical protein